jgi:hypothetical protein
MNEEFAPYVTKEKVGARAILGNKDLEGRKFGEEAEI